jgi:oxygen-independent coproporphyrinogen-3 oxidase
MRRALATAKRPELWLAGVEADGHALVANEALSPEAEGDEMLLVGLRLREGIDLARFEAITGRGIRAEPLDGLIGDGLVEKVGNSRVRATSYGLPVLDAIVADLAA